MFYTFIKDGKPINSIIADDLKEAEKSCNLTSGDYDYFTEEIETKEDILKFQTSKVEPPHPGYKRFADIE